MANGKENINRGTACYAIDPKAGWCVFKGNKHNGYYVEYWSGPFSDKAVANNEAKRLNSLQAT